MSTTGKVRVVVRSRRVPVGTAVFSRPVITSQGVSFGTESRRAILYETRFDFDQQKIIDDGKKLSKDYGLELEIVDLSRSNPLKRAAMAFLRGGSPISIAPASAIAREASVCADSSIPADFTSSNP